MFYRKYNMESQVGLAVAGTTGRSRKGWQGSVTGSVKIKTKTLNFHLAPVGKGREGGRRVRWQARTQLRWVTGKEESGGTRTKTEKARDERRWQGRNETSALHPIWAVKAGEAGVN